MNWVFLPHTKLCPVGQHLPAASFTNDHSSLCLWIHCFSSTFNWDDVICFQHRASLSIHPCMLNWHNVLFWMLNHTHIMVSNFIFIWWYVDGCLFCLCVLAIMNNALMQISLRYWFDLLSLCIQRYDRWVYFQFSKDSP